jgi:hypothetical protein
MEAADGWADASPIPFSELDRNDMSTSTKNKRWALEGVRVVDLT